MIPKVNNNFYQNAIIEKTKKEQKVNTAGPTKKGAEDIMHKQYEAYINNPNVNLSLPALGSNTAKNASTIKSSNMPVYVNERKQIRPLSIKSNNIPVSADERKKEILARELSVFSPAQINDYKNASSWLSDDDKKDAIVWQKNQGWIYGGNPEYEIQPSKGYEYMLDAPDGVYDHMLGEKKYQDAFFSSDGKYIATLPHVYEKYYNFKASEMSDDEIDKSVEYWGKIKDKADYMYNHTKDEKYKKISKMATYKKREFSGYIATKKANFTTDEDESFNNAVKGKFAADPKDINLGRGPIATKIDYSEFNEYAEKGKNNKNNPYRDGIRYRAVSGSGMGYVSEELTEYQKQYINALYGYFDAEEAGERAEYFLSHQSSAEMIENLNKSWIGRNVVAPAVAIATNTMGGVGTSFDSTVAMINNAVSDNQISVSKNSAGRQMLEIGEGATNVFIGDSKGAGYYVKSALIGAGESVFVSLLTGNPTAALYTMGISAMGREIDSQLDKGNTMGKAYLSGLASGGIEVATEKIPLDNLFDALKGGIKGATKETVKSGFVKNISKVIAKNGFGEGREEGISNIAGVLADIFVNGEKSDYKIYIKELVSKEGMSEEEATKQANKKFFLYDTASSAVIGMLSGVFSGGGAYTAGTVVQSAKNNALKNQFGFNPVSSGNSVYYYDGNLLSQGNKELTPINAQNQMPITKGKQINGIEASEAVNKHNQMKKSVSMEQKKILNFASKFARLNIIVSNVDLSSTMNLEGVNAKNALACYDPSTNSIILNLNKINSENELLEAVLLREMTHSAESSQHYGELAEFVINSSFGDLSIPQNHTEFNKALENKINDYYIASEKTVKLTPEGAKRELVEEYLAEILKNPDGSFYALQELARRDISTAKGILNTLKENFKRIKMKFTDISGYYTKYVNLSQYDKALDLFEKAVKDASKSRNATDKNIGFVIKESKEQGKVAFLDGKNIPRQKGESIQHAIRQYFNSNFREQQITVDSVKDDVIMDQIGKYLYPGNNKTEYIVEKNSVSRILDEIIKIADNKSWNKNLLDKDGNIKKHGGLDCSGGFNYYDTKFAVDNSGLIYGGTVIVRIDKKGRLYFYDLDNIREAGYQDENEFYPVKEISPLPSFAFENVSLAKEETSLDKNISQNTPVVNGNNSGNLTNNAQNDFTDYSEYRKTDDETLGLEVESDENTKASYTDYSALAEAEDNRKNVVRDGMSDEERYNILINKSIENVPKFDADKLKLAEPNLNTPISEAYKLRETDRKKLFVKIGEEFGVFKHYSNEDIELNFEFSKARMRESEQHQKGNYETFAKLFSCFDEVIDRAIGIEVHNRNDEGYKVDASLKEMYVLVSAFEDGENIVPVKLEIKEFNNKENILYVAVTLESIKKNEVVKAESANNSDTDTSRSFNISLTQLLKNVNSKDKDFIKYIPKQFFEVETNENTQASYTDYSALAEAEDRQRTERRFETVKEQNYYNRAVNKFRRNLRDSFNIANVRNDAKINELIESVTDEYLKNRSLLPEEIDALWDDVYDKIKIINKEFYDEHKDFKTYLKGYKIYISELDADNIIDFRDFNNRNFGTMTVTTKRGNGAVEVEAVYRDMNEKHPGLLDMSITHPADMLIELSRVAKSIQIIETELKSYDGQDAELYKEAYKNNFKNYIGSFVGSLDTLYRFTEGKVVPPVNLPEIDWKMGYVDTTKEINEPDEVITFGNSNEDYSSFVSVLKEKSDIIQNTEKIFDIVPDENKNLVIEGKVSAWVNKIFKSFGGQAVNPDLGIVEFGNKGAKSTTFHGSSDSKLLSVYAIKDVIEKGKIYKHDPDWKGRGYDTYIIAGKGTVDGKECILGIIVKNYPNQKINNKFYLHEIIKIGASADTAVAESNAVRVIASTPINNSITNPEEKVKNVSPNKITYDEKGLMGLYKERKSAQERYIKAERDIMLSDRDKAHLDRIVKGEITEEDLPNSANKDGIMALVNYKSMVDFIDRQIKQYNAIRKEILKRKADKLLENSDKWKDKKTGFALSRETMERNVKDIVGDKETAENIINEYFKPVHQNEAKRTRLKNKYRKRIKNLNISQKVLKGNKVSESYAVQYLGELYGDIESLNNKTRKTQADKDKLRELELAKSEFFEENPKFNTTSFIKKINNSIKEFREIYDELFNLMNSARVRNGYSPVEYRKNYFPHFITEESKSVLGQFGKAIGIEMDVTELPTNIAGKTHTFKPGTVWSGHIKERKGAQTTFDASEGFDKYIESISDIICHTDDIQKLRSLEQAIMSKYSEDGVQKEIQSLRENTTIDDEFKEERIEELKNRSISHLNKFVQEVREYTNLLANKKSTADRYWEKNLGRKVYNILNAVNGNVAVNMLGANLSSACTNLIPLSQIKAECSTGSIIKATAETFRNYASDDGLIDASDFLTNRLRGGYVLVKNNKEAIRDSLMTPMEFIDSFTSQVVWRSKYNDSIEAGLGVDEAIDSADDYAARLLADRSKGALPTIFSAKNPVTKTLTMFQVEVNNNLSYILKDIPRSREKKKEVALALMWYFLGAYLFNDLYEKFMGRRPAPDLIGSANKVIGSATGKKLPNTFDIPGKIIKGEDLFTAKKKDGYGVASDVVEDVAENIPFIGGFVGGGRIPISSAIPNLEELFKLSYKDVSKEKKKQIAKEEIPKIAYALWPYGGLSQIMKTVKGVSAVAQGGKYTYDNDGNKLLQYPVHNDSTGEKVKNYIQAGVFGRNALSTAQDWVKNDFDTMGIKDTQRFDMLRGEDVKSSLAFDVVKGVPNSDGDNFGTQYNYIEQSKLPEEVKAEFQASYLAKGTATKYNTALRNNIAAEDFVDAYYNFNYNDSFYDELSDNNKKALVKEKDKESSAILKRAYIMENENLTPEQKVEMDKLLVSKETKMTNSSYSSEGMFYYSLLTDNQKKRGVQMSKVLGYNVRTYYYILTQLSSCKKRDDKIRKLKELGMNDRSAITFYNIVYK